MNIKKVAIDTHPLESEDAVRGVGVYTGELLKELVKYSKKQDSIQIEPVNVNKTDSSLYEIVHYPYFHPFFITLPKRKVSKIVVTIHDLIPLIYKKHYPPGIKGRLRYLVQRKLLKNVDGIVTVSETSKKDIVRLFNIPDEKIKVIYEGVKEIYEPISDKAKLDKVKEKYDLPKSFVMYVGDVNYNKNLLGLAEACKLAKIALVIVGKSAAKDHVNFHHAENRPFAKFLRKYKDDDSIRRLGFVPDSELVAVFNLASVYCQPSFYEGFGLPVLEAMACGIPVVASKTQALVEVAADAALYANPQSAKDISKKIEKLIKSKSTREKLINKGIVRATEFSWDKTAKETIEFYKKLLG